jgi:hypothetical protein
MRKPRFAEQAEQLLIRSFGGVVQAEMGLLCRRDGTKHNLSTYCRPSRTVLIYTNRNIAAPDFAVAVTFQNGKIEVYARAGERGGQGRSE